MSRTEGIHLPRLPTAHARAVSPTGIQPLSAKSPRLHHDRFSPLTEPNYTAYIGTPRQDLPQQVYRDAAMFDDVFDKQGRLLTGRNTAKITSPLTSQQYNSLHDPHCQRLFLNNYSLREHLINLGLLTEDLRVVASTQEQRQRIRAHELLERKEQLITKLEDREQRRIANLRKRPPLPYRFALSMSKEEGRIEREQEIVRIKMEKLARIEQDKQAKEAKQKSERKQQLQQLLEQINLWDQTKRNAARAEQEIAEMSAYEKHFGWTAAWHRDSDRIHNRMILLSRTKWSTAKKQKTEKRLDQLSELDSTQSSTTSTPPRPTPPKDHTPPPSEADLPTARAQQETIPTMHKDIQHEGHGGGEEGLEEWMLAEEEEEEAEEMEEKPPATATTAKEETRHTQERPPQARPTETQPQEAVEELVHSTSDKADPNRKVLRRSTQDKSTSSLLNPNRSAIELSRFFAEILSQADMVGNGFISLEQFVQVISSRELGLPLDQEEILYIADQVNIYRSGWIPIIQVASILPGLITVLFQQRMQLELEQYGQFIEEQWCQLQSEAVGVLYLDKTSGLVQRERPDDFRPYLQDSLFEEMIVELFNSADMNQDGFVDYEDFVAFTQSPLVSGRVYTEQAKQVIEKFVAEVPPEGYMTLKQFVSITDLLISMIYKNSYPTQEWVELQSHKCGKFLFNPASGETRILDREEQDFNLSQSSQPGTTKRKRRRKRRESAEGVGGGGGTSGGPPPLRRRSVQSRESVSSQKGLTEEAQKTISEGEKEKEDRHSPVEEDSAETLVQEVAKQLQVGLRIIEPIPEEREEDLEASNGHPMMEHSRTGPVGGEQQPQVPEEASTSSTNEETTKERVQREIKESTPHKSKSRLKEMDTIDHVLGEVIAKREQVYNT